MNHKNSKDKTAGVAVIGRQKKDSSSFYTLSRYNVSKIQNLTRLLNPLSDEAGPLSPFPSKELISLCVFHAQVHHSKSRSGIF